MNGGLSVIRLGSTKNIRDCPDGRRGQPHRRAPQHLIGLLDNWNRPRGSRTSAVWKVIDRPWWTILAPIFISLSRSVVKDVRVNQDICNVRAALIRLDFFVAKV